MGPKVESAGLGYGDRSFSWTWLWRSWVNVGFGGLLTEGLVLGQICYTAYLDFLSQISKGGKG